LRGFSSPQVVIPRVARNLLLASDSAEKSRFLPAVAMTLPQDGIRSRSLSPLPQPDQVGFGNPPVTESSGRIASLRNRTVAGLTPHPLAHIMTLTKALAGIWTHSLDKSSPKADDVVLSWTLHLAREHPAKQILVVASLLTAATAGYYLLGVLGIVASLVVISSSIAEFLFPVSYRISTSGAECRSALRRERIEWSSVKACYLDESGVKLSPLGYPTRLEAFRGVYLRFADDNAETVIAAVRKLREQQCQAST